VIDRTPKSDTILVLGDANSKLGIFQWNPLTKGSQGRWDDNIKQDICQMKVKNWIICVQDRRKWKEVVEKAKTFCG
jgi:hypothetical protein